MYVYTTTNAPPKTKALLIKSSTGMHTYSVPVHMGQEKISNCKLAEGWGVLSYLDGTFYNCWDYQ